MVQPNEARKKKKEPTEHFEVMLQEQVLQHKISSYSEANANIAN